GERFRDHPDLECEVRNTLATAFFSLGDRDPCLANVRLADELAREHDVPETARLGTRLLRGWYSNQLGDYSYDIVGTARELYASAKNLKGPSDPQTIWIGSILIRILTRAYRIDEAQRLLNELEPLDVPSTEPNHLAVWVSSASFAAHTEKYASHEQLMRRR